MHGAVRFEYVSSTLVLLRPFNGNGLVIGDTERLLPPTGISAGVDGLAPDTTYNVYAAMRRAITLEFAATVHLMDPITNVETRADDYTRTLVGKVRTDAAGLFQPGALTLSWFNRRRKKNNRHFTDARMTTHAHDFNDFVELHSEIRVPFLTWGDAVRFDVSGCVGNDTRGHTTRTAVGVDNVTPLPDARTAIALPNIMGAGGQFGALALGFSPVADPLEGYHYATLLGNVSTGADIGVPGEANTGIWSGRYPDGVFCSLHVEVSG